MTQLTLFLIIPPSQIVEAEKRHKTVENVYCGLNRNFVSNNIDAIHSRDVEIKTNNTNLSADQQKAIFSMPNAAALTQLRKSTVTARQCVSSTPFVSPATSADLNGLQNDAKIGYGSNDEGSPILSNGLDSEKQRVLYLDDGHYESKHPLSSTCEQRGSKIKRIEEELENVKSSWDMEIRYIRYNMEILRNEIHYHT